MQRAEAMVFAVLAAVAPWAWSQGAQVTTGQPAPLAPVASPVPASRWTPAQIRQAFELADADANGQLSRAEAQRLPIMPRSFEEMDSNKDGVIVLPEYEAAFRS